MKVLLCPNVLHRYFQNLMFMCRMTNWLFAGNVGDFSCWGFEACERMEDNIAIGSHSCHGYQSCSSMGDRFATDPAKNTIDDFSCIGMRACHESYNSNVERNTGHTSCVGDHACYQMAGE